MVRLPRCLLSAALFSLLVLAAGPNAKATILFDFEDQSYGSFASISSTQGGLTATLYTVNSTNIDVQGPLPPASWLEHSITSYFSGAASMVIDFSAPVSSVSIQFGDYNQDDDVEIIDAYSGLGGSGSHLGNNTVFYPSNMDISNGDSDVGSLGIAAGGIMSVIISSGSPFPMSVYWDNLSVDSVAVPEPSTLSAGLLVLGLGGLYSWRRRKTV